MTLDDFLRRVVIDCVEGGDGAEPIALEAEDTGAPVNISAPQDVFTDQPVVMSDWRWVWRQGWTDEEG